MLRLAPWLLAAAALACGRGASDAAPDPAPEARAPAVLVAAEDVVIEHVPVREVALPDTGLAEVLGWQAPIEGVLTSSFGWRELAVVDDGVLKDSGGFHDAIDVAAPIGTEVMAPVDLRVRTIAYQERAGRHLIADVVNAEGAVEWRITFAHLSHVAVFEGDLVPRGAKLGLIGLSGAATGAHLHLRVEAVENGERIAVDPLPLFAVGAFEGAALPAGAAAAVGNGP